MSKSVTITKELLEKFQQGEQRAVHLISEYIINKVTVFLAKYEGLFDSEEDIQQELYLAGFKAIKSLTINPGAVSYVPFHVMSRFVKTTIRKLHEEYTCTREDAAALLKNWEFIDKSRLDEIKMNHCRNISLNQCKGSLAISDEKYLEEAHLNIVGDIINETLESVSEKLKDVITCRYKHELTRAKTGEVLGLSESVVRRFEEKAFRILRFGKTGKELRLYSQW